MEFINASEVKMSNADITQLTASISGQPAKRASDKPSAVRAFIKAMTSRVGEELANANINSVLMQDNFNSAHAVLGAVVEQADGGAAEFPAEEQAAGDAGEAGAEAAGTLSPENAAEASPAPALDGNQAAPVASETAGRRGRKPTGDGKRFFATTENNVRREGSHGYNSLQIIINNPGINGEDFLGRGGRLKDLRFDIQQGRVRLED